MSIFWGIVLLAPPALALAWLGRQLHQARAHAARVEARLAAALAAFGGGLSVWSADRRLLACNTRFRELYPDVPLKPGLELEDLLRFTVTRGLVQAPDGEAEAWVQARLAGFDAGTHAVVRTAAGRWLELRPAAVDGGETLLLYTDVTGAEESRAELAERSRQRDGLAADLELLRAVVTAAAAGRPLDTALAKVVPLVCDWAGWRAGRAWRVARGAGLRCEALPAALVVRGAEQEVLRALLAAEPASRRRQSGPARGAGRPRRVGRRRGAGSGLPGRRPARAARHPRRVRRCGRARGGRGGRPRVPVARTARAGGIGSAPAGDGCAGAASGRAAVARSA